MPAHLFKYLRVSIACVVLVNCSPREPTNKFHDDILVRISDFQDRRLGDSLYQFFTHPNKAYRQQAALAFASVQDSSASEMLGKILLLDEDRGTRLNAAYALGQTHGKGSSSLLIQAAASEPDSVVLQTILESIGKVADTSEIHLGNYDGPGVPWLCYRLGLRMVTPPEFTSRVAGYLSSPHDEMSRLGAAHFFAGSRVTDISDAESDLAEALRNDPSAEVRMAVASALGKIDSEASLNILSATAAQDSDYRVRINAIKSLSNFPFRRTKEVLLKSLRDSQINVSIAAAEAVQSAATEAFVQDILREARASTNWRVQALLFQGVNTPLSPSSRGEARGVPLVEGGPRGVFNAEIIKIYQSSTNNYQKAWLLSALSGTDALAFVTNELLTSAIPVIRSSAATVIVAMNREETVTPGLHRQFLDIYKKGIDSGDVAVIGLFTDALSDESLHYRELVTDVTFLHEAKSRLSLPRDYESVVPLEKAIAFFQGDEPGEIEKPFNHRIDWDLVRKIPADQQAIILTSKGTVVITLHVEEAPGSVANFVYLVGRQYFNGKFIHRVVPNFVIQDGCHRGDGWGSEDYAIRSEFTRLRYTTGSVGMASAGKDTEGTQWFITHSPPPRLDGRYSIFATVAEGMEVVHQTEAGDTIQSVTLSPPLAP